MTMHSPSLRCVLPLLSRLRVETVAKTAVDVVTLPVKVASAGVDAATTSQSKPTRSAGARFASRKRSAGKQARLAEERCRKARPLPTDNCHAVSRANSALTLFPRHRI